MYDEREARPRRSLFSGFAVVALLSLLLAGGVTTFYYQQCTATFWDSRWLYPDAEIVAETSYFLSAQTRTLRTDATPAVIEAWIQAEVAKLPRVPIVRGDTDALPDGPPFSIEADPQGNGTLLVYSRNCP